MSDKQVEYDILAVDDDEETIEGILSEFDLLGHSIDIARTLDEAEIKLRSQKYRVLLVDLRMQRSADKGIQDDGGLDLIRALRMGRLGKINRSVPYALVSAQEFLVDRLEARIKSKRTLAQIRSGRISRFSKGDSMKPLLKSVADVLRS